MLDETNLLQRLGAEVIGTAFLVFIGVGSVPATLIVNGKAPFTMADLGVISLAFGTIVIATVYASGTSVATTSTRRSPSALPCPASSRGLRCRHTSALRSSVPSSGRPRSSASSVRRPATSVWASRPTATSAGCRRSPPSSWAPSSSCSRSSASSTARPPPGFAGVAIGLVVFAAIIPVAPATGASINPARTVGPMLVQQIAGGAVKWDQLPVYLVAELLAGVVAALLYGVLTRTPADRRRGRSRRGPR